MDLWEWMQWVLRQEPEFGPPDPGCPACHGRGEVFLPVRIETEEFGPLVVNELVGVCACRRPRSRWNDRGQTQRNC